MENSVPHMASGYIEGSAVTQYIHHLQKVLLGNAVDPCNLSHFMDLLVELTLTFARKLKSYV